MHRSRVFGLFIDTPRAEADAAAKFWSAALGAPAEAVPGEEEFVKLHDAVPGFSVDVQAIDGAARYHLDIETDDVQAELARLLSLGAVVEVEHDGFTTLRAPGGHLVCVVPVQSDQALFDADHRTWP
jgi:hypothetical protein